MFSPQPVPASDCTENDDVASSEAPAVDTSAQEESFDYSSAESLNVSHETDTSHLEQTSMVRFPSLLLLYSNELKRSCFSHSSLPALVV